MTFSTPHGTVRYRLPWSWSSFDYRELCRLLWGQTDATFDTAKIEGRGRALPGGEIEVRTDRGTVRAPIVVDALGWRGVLSGAGHQPPEAPLTRALEVHPPYDGTGDALDVWIERSLTRRGYGWRVPATDEARIGACSYDPAQHVKEPAVTLAERLGGAPVGFQGNWIPHRLRPAAIDGVFLVGDSAGHCLPLSAEGIRTAFYFGIAAGREIRGVLRGEQDREAALTRYARFSARHARAFGFARRMQVLVPALPPRLLMLAWRLIGFQPIVDRAFGWYLRIADPAFAHAEPPGGAGRGPADAPREPAAAAAA